MKPVIIIAIAFVLLIPIPVFAEISITNDGGNCSKVGDWNSNSKTCTLNMDINETILVNANYVTVDGNNHQITGYGEISGENNRCISADAKIGIIIKNFKLTNCAIGIYLQDVLDSEFVENEIFNNLVGGIYFTSSNNNIIKNNKIYDNYEFGISFNGNGNLFEGNEITNNTHLYLEQTLNGWGISGNLKDSGNIFRNNIIKDHAWGLNFDGVTAKNEVQDNKISDNEIGIRLNTSEHFLILGNVIQNNGVGIESGMYGGGGGRNTIENNLIVRNEEGIHLESKLNILTENTISDNSEYGLWIVARDQLTQNLDNKIFNNNFINNARQVFHGEANFFTVDGFGNYWNDFSSNCVDKNSDKICDEPYPFSSGTVGVVDSVVWKEKDGWKTSNIEKITPEPETSSQIDPPSLQLDAGPSDTVEPKELGIASFVDKSKNPQSYIDRYNSEPSYKKWFDDNYSQYDSIEQAVGLELTAKIPDWIKNVFLWYGQDQVSENELLNAIKYLINEKILIVD